MKRRELESTPTEELFRKMAAAAAKAMARHDGTYATSEIVSQMERVAVIAEELWLREELSVEEVYPLG